MTRSEPDSSGQMGFVEAAEGRRSVRRFLPDEVPRDDVREIVRLATRAANAGNQQMWRFVAVADAELRCRLAEAVGRRLDEMASWPSLRDKRAEIRRMRRYATFFATAPLVIVVLGLPYVSEMDVLLMEAGCDLEQRDRLRARPDLQSIGAAVQLLCTAAYSLGYGTCWMTAPVIAAPELEQVLGLEPPARVVAVVPVGQPAGRTRRTPRRAVEEVLEFR
jgi:nitroreductase